MKKLFLLAFLLILCGCSVAKNLAKFNDDGTITSESAKQLIADGALLIDVRTDQEYNEGHIEGAVLMPVEMITKEFAKDIITDFDQIVIVYCKSGKRSANAASELKKLGYTKVYNLGAMANWK